MHKTTDPASPLLIFAVKEKPAHGSEPCFTGTGEESLERSSTISELAIGGPSEMPTRPI
jgi:hypothetical protein